MKRLRAIFLTPAAALMALTLVIPTVIIMVYSFLTRGVYGGVEQPFTLENYTRLFDPLYAMIFARSLWIAAVATALCIALGFHWPFLSRDPARERIST
jgi:spermidine/putrescine transport system permease protein